MKQRRGQTPSAFAPVLVVRILYSSLPATATHFTVSNRHPATAVLMDLSVCPGKSAPWRVN